MDRTGRMVQHYRRCNTLGNIRSRLPLHIESWRNNISRCEWKGRNRTSADYVYKGSRRPGGLASMAPLESGFAALQSSSQQRKNCSHRTHIDGREHESGLFRLQTGPQMKWKRQDVTADLRIAKVAD